jgi:RND family efflux transporter MFP subunit
MGPARNGFRWTFWLFGGLLAFAVTIGGWRFLSEELSPAQVQAQEQGQAPAPPAALPAQVVHPRKGAMQRTTCQPGTVQAFESVQLYAAVSGYLKQQTVDIGDRVKRDQVLLKVDVPELEKQVQRYTSLLDQARARVNQMRARVASARADKQAAQAAVVQAQATAKSAAATLRFRQQQLQRMKDLFALQSIDERLVDEKTEQRDAALEAERAAQAAVLTANAQVAAAQAKIDQAEADVVEAEAEVKVARAELEKTQVLVQYSTIVAPFDGVVTQRNFFPGDFVKAATEGGSAVPLLTVQRTDLMRVVVQIPDRDVPYADPGDPGVVEIDALPGQKFPAKIARIASSEDPDTRLMRVELDVPNPNGQIRNGMYGRVTIVLDKAADQLSLPSSCLVGRSADGKAKVFVVRDGHARLTPIEVGADNGLQVAVLRGLRETDEVIDHAGTGIADGAAVVVANARVH